MVELFPLEQLSKNLNKTIEGQRENQLLEHFDIPKIIKSPKWPKTYFLTGYWLNILNTK